jgi:rhamnose utilization protein RhaD (predicted bifunctional aldolase and dehydrogenase)
MRRDSKIKSGCVGSGRNQSTVYQAMFKLHPIQLSNVITYGMFYRDAIIMTGFSRLAINSPSESKVASAIESGHSHFKTNYRRWLRELSDQTQNVKLQTFWIL